MGVVKLKYKGEGRAFVADWKKIKKEYIAGGISHRKLSEKHGISYSTLKKVAAREHWTDLRNQAEAKEGAMVVDAVSSRNAQLDEAIDLALIAACEYLKSPGRMRAADLKDMTVVLKNLRELKGIKNEVDAEEQRARIEALRARAAANKVEQGDEEDEGGVILLPAVDKPEGGTDG